MIYKEIIINNDIKLSTELSFKIIKELRKIKQNIYKYINNIKYEKIIKDLKIEIETNKLTYKINIDLNNIFNSYKIIHEKLQNILLENNLLTIKINYNYNYEIFTTLEGLIIKTEVKVNILSTEIISENIITAIDDTLIKYKNFFLKEEKKYDDYLITIMILLSFNTEEGFRIIEKNYYRYDIKTKLIGEKNNEKNNILNMLNYLFEEYNIIEIDLLLIKII